MALQKDDLQNAYQDLITFNFPKCHSLQHFEGDIREYGALQQHSTEIGEASHKKQLKEGFHHSNKVDPTWQILRIFARKHGFAMRLMNLMHLIRKGVVTDELVIRTCQITGFKEQGDNLLAIRGLSALSQFPADQAPLDDEADDPFFDVDENGENTSGEDCIDSLVVQAESEIPPRRMRSLFRRRELKILSDVAGYFGYSSLVNDTRLYLMDICREKNIQLPSSMLDTVEGNKLVGGARVRVYACLQVALQDPHENGRYDIHRLRNTGREKWRNGPSRRDTIWYRT